MLVSVACIYLTRRCIYSWSPGREPGPITFSLYDNGCGHLPPQATEKQGNSFSSLGHTTVFQLMHVRPLLSHTRPLRLLSTRPCPPHPRCVHHNCHLSVSFHLASYYCLPRVYSSQYKKIQNAQQNINSMQSESVIRTSTTTFLLHYCTLRIPQHHLPFPSPLHNVPYPFP